MNLPRVIIYPPTPLISSTYDSIVVVDCTLDIATTTESNMTVGNISRVTTNEISDETLVTVTMPFTDQLVDEMEKSGSDVIEDVNTSINSDANSV